MSKQDYGSEYLYAEDLLINGRFKSPTVTISEYIPANTLTTKNHRKVDRPSIRFRGKEKVFVLNKTNRRMIHLVTGQDEGPGWVGWTITLQARVGEAFGDDNCLFLRVMPTEGMAIPRSLMKRLGRRATDPPQQTTTKPPPNQKKTMEELEREAADRAAGG